MVKTKPKIASRTLRAGRSADARVFGKA